MEADEQHSSQAEAVEEFVPGESNNLQLAFLLTLLALLIWHGAQTLQFLRDRTSLSLAKESQDAALQESQKLQGQFKTLLTKTGELAAKGHPGAKMVIDELQKRGVGLAAGPETKALDRPLPKPAEKPDIKSLK